MKYWILHNHSTRFEKMKKLIGRLHSEFRTHTPDVELLSNSDVIPFIDSDSHPRIKTKHSLPLPDAVLFWDKDLYLAKHLESMGIRLFNTADAIEICDDKSLTALKLANSGIALPKTIVSPQVFWDYELSEDYYERIVAELGLPLIIKEVRGSFGMQVHKAATIEDMKTIIATLGTRKFIFQQSINTSAGKDIRVNIAGGEIVGAMLRQNPNDFRANITMGGTATPYKLTAEQEAVALKVHELVELDFSGIDLLFGKDGEPILCEINSNPNFLSFEQATGLDFGGRIVQHVLEHTTSPTPLRRD